MEKRPILLFLSFLWILSVLFSSCANMVAPNGGEKDTKAPEPVKFEPKNFSTTFTAKTITIEFDEFIELRDASKILISPEITPRPEFKVRKKSLILELPDSLASNTTYSISFSSSVRDITEGNTSDLKYVFSTGAYLDSLTIGGTVIQAMNLEPEKDITVLLYPPGNDSVIFSKSPVAFTKTLANGTFTLTFLKPGAYRIYAVKDLNENLLYDPKDEWIGFSDTTLRLDSNLNGILLKIFQNEGKNKILSKTWKDKISLHTEKIPDSPSVKLLHNPGKVYTEYDADSILIWPAPKLMKDTLTLQISDGPTLIDTVRIFPPQKQTHSLTVKSSLRGNELIKGKDMKLIFSNPIEGWKSDSIHLQADSLPLLPFKTSQEGHRSIVISYPFKENVNYKLTLADSSISDIYGNLNQSFEQAFHLADPIKYATLTFKVTAEKGSYIAELINTKNEVVRKTAFAGDTTLNYTYINPDRYRMRFIEDRNANGKWDTGNLFEKRQPERMIYYAEELTLRENWDLESEFTLKKENFR